jgi:hypothetical protein
MKSEGSPIGNRDTQGWRRSDALSGVMAGVRRTACTVEACYETSRVIFKVSAT